jgi:hypothetical protein
MVDSDNSLGKKGKNPREICLPGEELQYLQHEEEENCSSKSKDLLRSNKKRRRKNWQEG